MKSRQYIESGDIIVLGGQVGVRDGSTVPGGVGPETAQAIANMKSTLEAHGRSLNDVIQVTIYLRDMATYDEMNEAYFKAFEGCTALPVRAAVGINGLDRDFNVELVPLVRNVQPAN